jgi:peptidyl-prolyl cis-trans isomerase B (cyclophilin B)
MGIRQKLMLIVGCSLLLTLLLGMPASSKNVERETETPGILEDGVIYTEPQELNVTNRVAVIEVQNYGTIKIELYDNMTPITTDNFAHLAEKGFYDGIKFHRCIDDFVAQTGDPNTKNSNPYDDGWGGSGATIPLEICYNATHVDGAVGMARESDPATASSQFYICDGPQHQLDDEQRMEDGNGHGYAVFGVVIEGLDIAKKIAGCETWGYKRPLLKDHPVDDITMTSVTIIPGEPIEPPEDEKGKDDDSDPKFVPGLEVTLVLTAGLLILLHKRR